MAHTAIITAGGTTESIDDVRLVEVQQVLGSTDAAALTHIEIANISGGNFGYQIARAFAEHGVYTALIGKRDLIRNIPADTPNLRLVPFRSTRDLAAAIEKEIARSVPDFFLMAAAVSDYSPVAFAGKLSSDSDELVIQMKRNPKLLDSLRSKMTGTTLVGFKLVSGLSDAALFEIATRQNERADLDCTVGNDLKQIDFAAGIHPISVISRSGEVCRFSGLRESVASELVRHLLAYRS